MIRRLILILCLSGMFFMPSQLCFANSTRNLYYAAKVWGYLKYFHPAVNGCDKNLDSILIALIPEIERDSTGSSLNATMLKMFDYAGPMPEAATPAPSLTPDETINLDLAWQHDTALSQEVQALLDSIRVNFRPVQTCYYETNPKYEPPYLIYERNDFPLSLARTEPYRLLLLFRLWNMCNYFYPYKTLLDSSWDSTLQTMIPIVRSAQTILAYHLALMEFQARLQDAHAITRSDTLDAHFGFNFLPMFFSYIDSQTVITKVFQGVTGIKVGDVVLSIDGTPTQAIRDSLRKYTPGGNPWTINRNISELLLEGVDWVSTLVVDDGSGPRTITVDRSASGTEISDSITTLQGSHWKILPGDIGYVNMGIADSNDIKELFPALKKSPAIIFDMRNYPQNFLLYQWCDSLMPRSVQFSRFFYPDPAYPGTGHAAILNCGPLTYNPNYYKGKLILLVNEVTLSRAEFYAMAFSRAPNVLIIGSQTAGADGDVDYASYPTGVFMEYSSYGVSFPDGRQTQRVGIVPNIVVRPTIADIRAGIDPVLDTAIILAGGSLVVHNPSAESLIVRTFPNPAEGKFNVILPSANVNRVTISNSLGEAVWSHQVQESDVKGTTLSLSPSSGLPAGMYLIRVWSDQGASDQATIIIK